MQAPWGDIGFLPHHNLEAHDLNFHHCENPQISEPCVCHDLQQEVQNGPDFLPKVITDNVTWVYSDTLETKQQVPQPKKARHVKSMLLFDCDGALAPQTKLAVSSITQMCCGIYGRMF
jgi:hypothetical protein